MNGLVYNANHKGNDAILAQVNIAMDIALNAII